MSDKPNCYTCKYRGTVPGDAHSCCRYPGTDTGLLSMFTHGNAALAKQLNIKANAHGVRRGWFAWPVNFDPIWLENCDGYVPKPEKEKASKD